jgi:SSS family solute:Na+ symporter
VGSLFSLGIGVLYLWVFPTAHGYHWPHFMMLSFLIFCVESVFCLVVTLLDKKGQDSSQNTLKPFKFKTDGFTRWMWIIFVCVMVALYLYFNGH